MNYYEHHLGDYARDTAHLSMLEHGAYRLLLDRYYATEAGIPASQTHRLCRARTKDEKQAVDAVLDEFFMLVNEVWINSRAEEEIVKAHVKISAAQSNGKKGGRPKKPFVCSENETNEKPTGLFAGSENETQQKAHQTPDTRHQTPVLKTEAIHTVSDPELPTVDSRENDAPEQQPKGTSAGMACKAMREAGIPDGNPTHPTLMALLDAGATADEFKGAACEAVRKGKASFAYVVGTVKRRREEAARLVLHTGRMPNRQEAIEAANKAATSGWKPPELRENIA